jgi:hypothetical protein
MQREQPMGADELGPEALRDLAEQFWDRAANAEDAAVRTDWLVLAAYHEKLACQLDGAVRVDH